MRVDCYNACECELKELTAGDTFYLDGALYLKVSIDDVDVVAMPMLDRCLVVDLARGVLKSVKAEAIVLKADTRVVAYGD